MAEKTQPSFTGGVLAEALYGRTDFSKYPIGLKEAVNMFIHAEGGVSNRAGTRFVGHTPKINEKARLIPFNFNSEQTYALLFQEGYAFPIRDGGYILVGSSYAITNVVTPSNPCRVEAPGHNFSNNDYVYIYGVGGTSEITDRIFQAVNVVPGVQFELSGIDGSSYTPFTSGGTVQKIVSLELAGGSYLESELSRITYTQDADTLVIAHPDHPLQKITRTSDVDWTAEFVTWGSNQASIPGFLSFSNATPGTTLWSYAVVPVNGTNFEKGQVQYGSRVAAETITPANWINVSWSQAPGARWYEIYRGLQAHQNYITTVDANSFRDTGEFIPQPITPPYNLGNFLNNPGEAPGAVTFFQQRLYLGGSNNQPQTLWGSAVGHFFNTTKHYPTLEDDSLSFSLAASEVNRIRHLVGLDSLICLTSGGEWVIDGGGIGLPVTPKNVLARKRGQEGASFVTPIVIDDDVLFVQDKGGDIRSISYKEESGGYIGDTVSILASHYFKGYQIVDWCYSRDPDSVVWAVRNDGKLLSLVYLKRHEVYGWCEHETDGEVETVCSIGEGNRDAVYMVVKRRVNGIDERFVERMEPRLFDDIQDGFFVDAGATYDNPVPIQSVTQANPIVVTTSVPHGLSDGDNVDIQDVVGMTEINGKRYTVANATASDFELTSVEDQTDIDGTGFSAYESSGQVRDTITTLSGLDYLEGKEVAIVVNGQTHPKKTVSNGSITLDFEGSKVHVGLPFTSRIETLDVEFSDTVRGKRKNIGNVAILFKDTVGCKIGPDTDNLLPLKWRETEDWNEADRFFTGEKDIDILPSWSRGGNFVIQQDNPQPITVLSVSPEITIGDR
jgi:hypothetical protein